MKEEYFIDIAHMHPICPLSLSHARIFVLADVWARWKRRQGFFVRFPICMHYSGSTVFKITEAISKFLQKQKLNDKDKKVLDLILTFYKIPREDLNKFTKPIGVLDYFSDVILNDLKKIQISCGYNDYFNTTHRWYQEFVHAVFDVYAEKGFITTRNKYKSLNYPNLLFKNQAAKRLNKTNFSPFTAKTMVAESLEKLDDKWSFERDNSIGTRIDKKVVDPMFDAEFLSIFNAIYPHLKDFSTHRLNLNIQGIFKEFLYKMEDPDKKVSSVVNNLYLKSQEALPVDIFFVERHLQNWVAKRIYTEAILLPFNKSTREYFFIGSITNNGQVDSASRGRGVTLSQLLGITSPEIVRLALLLTFSTPHRDYEWSSTLKHAKRKLRKFENFFGYFKNHSMEEQPQNIKNVLYKKRGEIENLIQRGNIRKILFIIFDELPKIIRPMLTDLRPRNGNKELVDFFSEYLDIFCPSLSSKIYGN